jgi:hypothetical protein
MKITIKLPKSITAPKLPVTKANQQHKSKKDYRRQEKHKKKFF